MSFLDSFNTMSNNYGEPTESFQSMSDYTPKYTDPTIAPVGWEEDFKNFRSYPSLYNLDGFVSSQPYFNWGNNSPIIAQMSEDARNIIEPNRIDPNKIFTSEIQSLRKIGSDQYRIIKMFEKKFMECITEKGKYGLTEEDVLAFNALMTARGQLTATTKEQVAIKKNIAELKIKQNQAIKQATAAASAGGESMGSPTSPDAIGRSVLDNIFNMNFDSTTPAVPVNTDYTAISASDASSILDTLIPSDNVSTHIQYESMQPKTFVVVGKDESDVEFQTFTSSGELIPDYPNPTSKITNIDKDTGKATDDLLVQYDIKFRDEL